MLVPGLGAGPLPSRSSSSGGGCDDVVVLQVLVIVDLAVEY